jgi:8-oxo-dGTP pyrophosphatase MutT (NUDIX family)
MSGVEFTIPEERVPPGLAERIDGAGGAPVPARPAATIVLLRPGPEGPEVLLVRRGRSAGFVPGAYVFPGGRVDEDDAEGDLLERVYGLTPEGADHRLSLPRESAPRAIAYYTAAVREAFEEVGILVGRLQDGSSPPSAAVDPSVEALQIELLADDGRFPAILDQLGAEMDLGAMEYIAHWITPEVEPRRYDTRFFAARVPPGTEVRLNEQEMTDARWTTPEAALEANRRGDLPMIFPTLKTLVSLSGYPEVDALFDDARRRPVPTIMPRLVRTPRGVGIEVP